MGLYPNVFNARPSNENFIQVTFAFADETVEIREK